MSEYTRALMASQHGIAPEDVEVLPPPPSIEFLSALGGRARATESGRAAGSARLLFVGRVTDPRKNAALLLEAFRAIRNVLPDATLTIVGRYTPQWAVRSGARHTDERVALVGQLSTAELADAYLSHDALIVSSRQEGYGLVVAEALHAGLPVISTRCGGPEGILRDSQGGAIVDHTPHALARAVLELMTNDSRRTECARSAAAFARRELSFDRFASRVADITRSVAGAGRRDDVATA